MNYRHPCGALGRSPCHFTVKRAERGAFPALSSLLGLIGRVALLGALTVLGAAGPLVDLSPLSAQESEEDDQEGGKESQDESSLIEVEGGEQVVRPREEPAGEEDTPFLSGPFGAGARTVIPREKFRGTQKTVADVLQEVPGVTLTHSGDALSPTRVTIRGSRSDQVLIVVDGVPLTTPLDNPNQRRDQGRAGADLSSIPLSQVESIEVVRGAASGIYGPGAVAGAIVITTRRPTGSALELAGTVGSGGYREEDLLWSHDLGGDGGGSDPETISIRLNHRRSLGRYVFFDAESAQGATGTPSASCTTDLGGGFFERGCNSTRVATLEAAWHKGDQRRLALAAEWYRKDGLGGIELAFPAGREVRRKWRLDYQDGVALAPVAAVGINGAQAAAAEGPSLGWNAHLERLASERNQDLTDPNAPLGSFSDERAGAGAWVERWSGRLQSRFGSALEKQVLDDLHFRAERSAYAAYGSLTRHGEAGTLEGSARYDGFSDIPGRATGRAAFSESILGGLGAKGGVGTGYRPPTLYELNDPGSFPGASVANPDLRPETSVSGEAGFYFRQEEFLYAEALYFRQDTKDNIIALPDPLSPSFFRFENVSRTRGTGIEAALNLRFSHGFSLDASYTRLDAVILANDALDARDNGNQVPGVPRERASLSAAWRQGGWHAWFQARHSGARFIDTDNIRFLRSYTLLDAGLTLPLGAGFEAGLEGRNLTNATYAELDNFPPPGRQGFLTVRWKDGGAQRR